MGFIAAITDVGNAAAEAAIAGAYQIEITTATFSSNILTPTIPFLESVTTMTNVTFTAPTPDIGYHIINANSIMLRVSLPVPAGPFNYGSYSLNLSDGTPFAVGTWTTLQTKDTFSARYIELTIVFTNFTSVLNVTILNTIDAALPEVPTEADLPAPTLAPYPVYYVDNLTLYQGAPALASRFSGSWYYYPSLQTYYAADTGTVNTLVAAYVPAFTILGHIKEALYIRVAHSNTMEVTLNVNGVGALPLVNLDGSSLIPGQIVQNSIIAVIYDVVNNNFQLLTPIAKPSRVRLVAPLILYVANTPTGNDANDGLTFGTPWEHPQVAWNYIQDNIDANSQFITVLFEAGINYVSGVFAAVSPLGGNSGIIFLGDYYTPDNVVVTVPAGDCFVAAQGVVFSIRGMKLSSSTVGGDYIGGGSALASLTSGIIYFDAIDFGFTAASHMDANGVISSLGRPYYISSGSGAAHTEAETGGEIATADSHVLFSGTCNFVFAFASARFNSTNAAWNQVWANNNIIKVAVNYVGSGMTDGTRTFTVTDGQFITACQFTATVTGGSVVPGTEIITVPGDYRNIALQQTTPSLPSGISIIPFASTTGLVPFMVAGHLNIPPGTYIVTVGPTSILLSNPTTGVINDADDNILFTGMPALVGNSLCTVDTGGNNATFDFSLATGLKFLVDTNSTINTQGASFNEYFPTNLPGIQSTATGGYYV